MSNASPRNLRKVLQFPISKDHFRKFELEKSDSSDQPTVTVYHLYPTLSSWVGRAAPDDVNPRSHEEKSLSGNVPKAIEETLRESPGDFYLANRGVTIVADSVNFDPKKESVEIVLTEYEGDDALHGTADGGTTDAVVARVQKSEALLAGSNDITSLPPSAIPAFLSTARLHLEVIVGLEDRDRIRKLVQGRNTSRQVKSWTIADFKGTFDWLKNVLEDQTSPLRGRVGYEENAGSPASVLDVLAVLTLFHREFDSKGRAPTVAYSSKGRMDARLAEPDVADGYRLLSPIICDILKLHDYVYQNFHKAYQESRPNGKLGRWGTTESRIFPKVQKALPLTGAVAEYTVPTGVLFPLLASMRALITYDAKGSSFTYDKKGVASWLMNPFKFFDKYGPELVDNLFEQLTVLGNNPQSLGKAKTAYTALHNVARLLVADQ